MGILNLISLAGIFGLCAVAWLFSENRSFKVFPWRVMFFGIGLQLILGFLVFWFPITRIILEWFSGLLDSVFVAADTGARFVFGNRLIPEPGVAPEPGIGTIFAFRVLPSVIFFSGLVALLYSLGWIQPIVNFFAKVFYAVMRLSGAESLSGAANIFVGIEAAIVVKPYLAKMTRSELCAILACCFGTAASSTLAIYVGALRDVFPSILLHLISASIIAIPASFVLSKILVPETEVPVTAGGIPQEGDAPPEDDEVLLEPEDDEENEEELSDEEAWRRREALEKQWAEEEARRKQEEKPQETVAGEPLERMSPIDAAIVGSIDGLKMAATIAAVLIFIQGALSLIDQGFLTLAAFKDAPSVGLRYVGQFFSIVSINNFLGALFLPLTALTGVSLEWNELWESSVLIGSRLLRTAIPPYIQLGQMGSAGEASSRMILIVSYALSGFAHLASVGIFVGGTISLIPSRRKDIIELGWKALFAGTLATYMIACVAGVFDNGSPGVLGVSPTPPASVEPAPESSAEDSPVSEEAQSAPPVEENTQDN